MAATDWVFDPLPPSGAIVGGTAASYVFTPDLDVFVREVLQNAHDQRSPSPGQARVDLDIVEFTGRHRATLLDAIAFDRLREHLSGVAAERHKLGRQIRAAVDRIDGEPLRILRITDRQTVGLVGAEDEKGTNFNSLCRDVLVNTDSTAGRGGSYGLGKAVLWRFSALSTVLFVSNVGAADPVTHGTTRLRAFGRADLANHRTPAGAWAGPGWFGTPQARARGRRAESFWDDDAAAMAAAVGGHLLGSTDTGTTVAVLAFDEPGAGGLRPLGDIADDLAAAAERWFWPAMTRRPPSLEVTVGIERNGHEVQRRAVDPSTGSSRVLISTAYTSKLAEYAVSPGAVAARRLAVTVPARRDIDQGQVQATVELRVRRCDGDEADLDAAGRVALVRGAGMVVEHRRPRRSPTDGGPFHAVLLAGLSHGSTTADEAVEAFLRAAEPPAHNRWVHDTDMVRSNYRPGAKKQLDALWRAIDNALVDIADPEVPTREPGPPELAKLFAVGSSGDPLGADHRFDIRPASHRLVDGVWTIELGAIRLQRRKPWRIDLSVWLDADSGRGEPLALTDVVATVPITTSRLAPHHLHIDVGAEHGETRLTLTVPVNGRSRHRHTARLRVDARPSILDIPIDGP